MMIDSIHKAGPLAKKTASLIGKETFIILFQMSVQCSEFRRKDPTGAESLNAEH